MNKTQQFAWHSSHEYFGTITDNNHILIFDTKTNEKLQDFILPFNLSTKFTSISFSPTATVSKKKKKSTGTIYIACGTSNGKVIIWNVTKGDLLTQLETGDTKEVFLDFSDVSNLLVSTQNIVGTFFVSSEASTLQKLKIGKDNQIGGVKSTEKYYMVGTSNLTTLFEKTSRKKTLELQGHSSEAILFANEGDYILTAANDNFMNLFSLDKLSNKMLNPIQVLSMEDYPVCVDMKVQKGIVDVLALTHKGVCLIWRLKKFGKKGVKSDGKIVKDQGIILSAKFSREKDTIFIATGTNINPMFEEISFIEDDVVIKSLTINKQIVEQSAPKYDEKATILGSINMETDEARFKTVLGNQNGVESDENFDDKIEDIEIIFKEKEVPKVSIAPTLSHALKFNDKKVIINCLEQNNDELIKETVSLLPSKLSLTLLDVLLDAYQDQQVTNTSLVKWTRSILLYHSSSIMSSPNILKKLSPLYHSLNSKLETYTSLLDLSGRLDLVLGLSGNQMIGLESHLDDVDTNIDESSTTDDEPLQLEEDLGMKQAPLKIYDEEGIEEEDDDEGQGGFGNPENDSGSDLEFPDDEEIGDDDESESEMEEEE